MTLTESTKVMASASPYFLDNDGNTYHNSANTSGYIPPRTPAQNIPTTQAPYHHHGNQQSPASFHNNQDFASGVHPDSRYSGGSVASSRRPPSTQSGGYRLATGLSESDGEGYLAPRSSAGSSYQYQDDKNVGPRHDSGVEIDNKNHTDNRSSNSDVSSKGSVSFNPAGAASNRPNHDKSHKERIQNGRPESIAYRSHDYEELPLKKDQYVYADVDDNDKSNTTIPSQQNSSSGSRDNLHGQPANYRRRQNPLYDAIIREDSKASSKPSQGVVSNRCLCVVIIVAFTVAIIALIVAVVAVSGSVLSAEDQARTVYMVSTPSYTQLQQALDRLDDLQARYEDLMDKVSLFENNSAASLAANVSAQSSRLGQLAQTVQGVQETFVQLRADVQHNVSTISRMPGPQGPSGVGNLSACWHQGYSQGVQNGPFAFSVEKVINSIDQVVTGAECSADLATHSFLKMDNVNSTSTKYTCRCSGTSQDELPTERYCRLFLWFCPRYS